MKRKEKKSEKLNIWCYYFTNDWLKSAIAIKKDERINQIMSNFRSPSFNLQKIEGDSNKESSEDFYADKFLLNDPIPMSYGQLSDILCETKHCSALAKESATLLMQYEIIIMYQLPKLFQGILSEKELSEKLAKKLFPLLTLFSDYSTFLPVTDFVIILRPLYEFLNSCFTTAPLFPSSNFGTVLIQHIFSASLEFLIVNGAISYQNQIYLFEFLKNYILFYGIQNQELIWKTETIDNFINLFTKFYLLDEKLFNTIEASYLISIYENSFAIFDYVTETSESYDVQKIYILIASFFNFYVNTRNRKEITDFVCKSSKYSVIAEVFVWVVVNFPFTDTYFFEERGVEEKIYFNNLELQEITGDRFLHQNNLNILDNNSNEEYLSVFNEYIAKINSETTEIPSGNIKNFINIIQRFQSLNGSEAFFEGVINAIFSQIEILKKKETDQQFLNASLFIVYMVIKLLCSIHVNYSIYIFEATDIYAKLFFGYVFSPELLVNDLTLKEQDFLDDIRISFLSLTKSVYLNSEYLRDQINASLFTLINNRIIESLPYLLAFLLAIQKCDKVIASEFLADNIFIKNFSQFMLKMDIKGVYKKLVNETIHIAFTFLMNFIDSKTTSIYFTKSPLFFKMLHTYFFNSQIHDLAILIYTQFIIAKYDDVQQQTLNSINSLNLSSKNSIDSKSLNLSSKNSIDSKSMNSSDSNNSNIEATKEIPYNTPIYSLKDYLNKVISFKCKKDNDHWKLFTLLKRVLLSIFPAIQDNRFILYPIMLRSEFLQTTAQLITLCQNEQELKDLFQILSSFYSQISVQFPNMRRTLYKISFPIIINELKSHVMPQNSDTFLINDINFFVNLLMNCIFELQLPSGLLQIQPKLDIMNPKLLPYVHELTQNTLLNEQIFQYMIKICHNSINNKFQIFHSKMMPTIINYIVSFKEFPNGSAQEKNYIYTMIDLFTIVSSLTIKCQTLYKALSYMKPDESKKRKWYNELFINAFTNILQAPSKNSVKSFIRSSDASTALKIEPFPSIFLGKTFTMLFRFQLSQKAIDKQVTLITIEYSKLFNITVHYEKKMISVTTEASEKFKVETDYELQPDVWYQLCFSINNQLIRLFVNGEKVIHHNEPSLTQSAPTATQGLIRTSSFSNPSNTPQLETVSISILRHVSSTINVFYLFNESFDEQVVRTFASLPIDFISLFNQECYDEYLKLNKDASLPQQLFIKSPIEKATIACYNTRMSIGIRCQNMAQSEIGEAITSGQIIPYSYSFSDIVLRSGGTTLFLPLLSQVTLNYEEASKESNIIYLNKVLTFLYMLLRNERLANHFVQNKGFMAMASIIKSIDPEIINFQNIQVILNIYNNLPKNCKIDMMKNIFLNLPVWNRCKPKDASLFSSFIIDELNVDFENFAQCTSIGLLIAILNREENENIRKSLWMIIRDYARHRFTDNDADDILLIAEIASNQKIQVEAAQSLCEIINDERNDFSTSSFINYQKLFSLFDSPDEKIFIVAIKILTLLSRLRNVNFEGMLIHLSEREMNIKISKETVVDLIQEITLQEDAHMIYIFIAISRYLEKDIIYAFTDKLRTIKNIGSRLTSINTWYFWLTYLLLNTDKEVDFNSSEISPIMALFANCLVALLKEGNKASFSDFIGFFTFLQVNYGILTPMIIRRALNNMFSFYVEKPTKVQQNIILSEILSFIFFIPSTESYFDNIQLFSDQYIFLETKSKTSLKLKDMLISNPSLITPEFQYSARITKSGHWEDIELAIWFVQFFVYPTFNANSFVWFAEAKFVLSDLCAYICGFIARASSEKIPWSISTMTTVMEMSPNESSFFIFSNDLIHAVAKYPKYFTQMQKFFVSNEKFFPRVASFNSIEEVFSNATFLQKCAEFSVQFYDDFASLTNDNRFDRIYKMRNKRVCQIIDFFNEAIQNKPHKVKRENIARSEFYSHTVSRVSINCDKSLKSLRNTYLRDGGPWSIYDPLDTNQHMKISNIYDVQLRKIFMKSNLDYDPFMYKDATKASVILNKETIDYSKIKVKKQNSISDVLFTVSAKLITIQNTYSGKFSITSNCDMFFDDSSSKSISFKAEDVEMILRRYHLHKDCGMEFFLVQKKSYLFAFPSIEDRKNVTKFLKTKAVMPHLTVFQAEIPYETIFDQQKYTESWQNGEISTFEYLMYINLFAGRSLNDLTQYPVFPWVIKDYSSEMLDLTNPRSFRDLSKPMAAINPERLANFKAKFEDCEIPKYPFMYSHPFGVVHFLMRTEPFTTAHVKLQGGFDDSSRTFANMQEEWVAVNNAHNYFIELIPEFYYMPDFLYNRDEINVCKDVVLPKWAKSPENFIQAMKEALESNYVSQHLNEWIDLIFGYKQKGEIARQNDNLFNAEYYLDWNADDEVSKAIAETSGTVPIQLLFILLFQHIK